MALTIRQIKQVAKQKKIMVNENELLLKMLLRGHSSLELTGGKLTDRQIKKIEIFVNSVLVSMKNDVS